MDQLVDGLLDDGSNRHVQARVSVFDRSRHAIAHFTLLMLAVSMTFAAVGTYFGPRYLADQAMLAQPAELDPASDPAAVDRAEPAAPIVSEATTSTTVATTSGSPVTTSPSPAVQAAAPPASPPVSSTTSSPPIPSTAPAGVPVDNSPEARGQRALGAISYPWQSRLPGWTIVFLDGRSGLFGLTLVDDKRIEIYVRSDQTQDLLVHIVAHEIGHAVDVTLNDGPDRRRWQGARDIGDAPWWPDSAASDFRTGAGDFAESFAYWQTRTGNYRSKLGPSPDAAQLDLMAELAYG